jgi:hypothetical protein
MGSSSPCLVDAQVVIDGFKYCFFDALVTGHAIYLSGWVRTEVAFFVADDGAQVPIALSSYVETGSVRIDHASAVELTSLAFTSYTRRLGRGELECLALVVARGYCFCTADHSAVRAMNDLGVLDRWMPLGELHPAALGFLPASEAAKYTRSAISLS